MVLVLVLVMVIDLPGEDITVEMKRGLVIIRGVTIVSVHICGPPPSKTVHCCFIDFIL